MTGRKRIPEKGVPKEDLLAALAAMRGGDADWRSGRTWSLVYFAGDEHTDLLQRAYTLFFSENALNPLAFPSLRRMENEVLAMTAAMLSGDEEVVGTMTSGGTESLFLALLAYREWARKHRPEIARPEVLLPITAHPAFEKAAHYLGLTTVHIPVGPDFRADVAAARDLVSSNTILVAGSAPAYPHGVIDPIADLAALAAEHGLGFHVDACLGGFLLPWLRRLGEPIPPFDFAVPGVTSISADIHKYGYAAKGASTILYRSAAWRRHQFFAYTGWPGGIYASPSASGTRPGGAIAAAWAAMHGLGEEGYLRLAQTSLDAARAIRDGIRKIPGLFILGEPAMTVLAFGAEGMDVYALGDAMERRGWHLDRQQLPPSLHLMVTAAHARIVEPFLADLCAATDEVRNNPAAAGEGLAAMYGMMAAIPERAAVDDFVLDFLGGLFTPEQ